MDSSADGSRAEALSGRQRRERAQGAKADTFAQALVSLDPALLEWTDSFVFGDVWGRPGLGHRDRTLVAIIALATLGNTRQLTNYLHGALQGGMPESEIHEALLMLTVYAGFPTALEAIICWKAVLESHQRSGEWSRIDRESVPGDGPR